MAWQDARVRIAISIIVALPIIGIAMVRAPIIVAGTAPPATCTTTERGANRTPAQALRYPAIEHVFAKKCASCHDSRTSNNAAARRVFEMSSYPFATQRPATLLRDLRAALIARNLTDAERCDALAWIDGGGLDANGNPPAWRR